MNDFSKVIELGQKPITSYLKRANAYRRLERYAEAITDFDHCINLGHNKISVYIKKSSMYLELEKFTNALDTLSDGINFVINSGAFIAGDSSIADAYYKRGKIKSLLEDYNGAIEDFTKCIETCPEKRYSYNAYKMRADMKYEIKGYAGAIEDRAKFSN